MFVPVTLKLVGQELSFTVGLTLDLACKFSDIKYFLFSLSFLCYALNFMTAGGQLECCLSSHSPPTLSGQRLCWTHAGIFQIAGPKSLWGMTGIYHLVILNLMCVFIVFEIKQYKTITTHTLASCNGFLYNKREFGFLIYKWQIVYPSLDAPKTSKVYSFSIYIYKAILYYKKINIFITCLKFLFCSVLKCAL